METREIAEKLELERLSPYARKSISAKRELDIERCPIRTEYQRDRDRIIHSKSFRRLMHKTQVFIAPEGDHYRTRLSHTLEVSQIARTIARGLNLNEDLTEAIALGHDLGHTPFGHAGEEVLDRIMEEGFRHNEQSVRVVSVLEKLNLTEDVIDGIRNHRGGCTPASLEGKVVQLADKIGYMNHDIDDAIRAGVLHNEDLPHDCVMIMGETSKKRIDFMVKNIIRESYGKNYVSATDEAMKAQRELRKFLFETIYLSQLQSTEKDKIKKILSDLFFYYEANPEKLPTDYYSMLEKNTIKRTVCDFVAGMTDRYAIKSFSSIFIPISWGNF